MQPTEPTRRWRERAGRMCAVMGLIALAVVAGVNLVAVAERVPAQPLVATAAIPDAVVRQERRMASVRRSVERHGLRGVIGYIGDLPGARVTGDAGAMEDYFLTQFALAPLVLDLEAERGEWAVTNLRTTKAADRLPAGFRVVEDCGEGVLLVRKVAP